MTAPTPRVRPPVQRLARNDDQDFGKGAIEGDDPADAPQQGNPNAPALNDQGLPDNPVAIAEDVVGANEDQTQG